MFRTKLTEKKEKNFQSMIELMLDTPQWKMKVWKVTLEEQANQWQMKIPGVSSTNDAKAVKKLITIMNAMTDDELDHPERIRGPQREKIALKAEATPEEVSNLINNFRQTLVTYEWLKYKKAHGETLPTTEHELASMQTTDARVKNIAAKILNPEGARHKPGRKRSIF